MVLAHVRKDEKKVRLCPLLSALGNAGAAKTRYPQMNSISPHVEMKEKWYRVSLDLCQVTAEEILAAAVAHALFRTSARSSLLIGL